MKPLYNAVGGRNLHRQEKFPSTGNVLIPGNKCILQQENSFLTNKFPAVVYDNVGGKTLWSPVGKMSAVGNKCTLEEENSHLGAGVGVSLESVGFSQLQEPVLGRGQRE